MSVNLTKCRFELKIRCATTTNALDIDSCLAGFGNDVTKSACLLNPNHYLAVAIWYLFQN